MRRGGGGSSSSLKSWPDNGQVCVCVRARALVHSHLFWTEALAPITRSPRAETGTCCNSVRLCVDSAIPGALAATEWTAQTDREDSGRDLKRRYGRTVSSGPSAY